jgi:hypothetical protein
MRIMRTECAREQDVLDAVTSGRWDDDLREHTRACRICQDVATVFEAISEERESAWEEATVPPASVVWWRAQIQAREEATRAAARPIAVAQAVAVSCLIAAALALMPLALPSIRIAAASAADVAEWLTPRAAAVSSVFSLVTGTALPILPFTVASVLLAPILLYYALTEE